MRDFISVTLIYFCIIINYSLSTSAVTKNVNFSGAGYIYIYGQSNKKFKKITNVCSSDKFFLFYLLFFFNALIEWRGYWLGTTQTLGRASGSDGPRLFGGDHYCNVLVFCNVRTRWRGSEWTTMQVNNNCVFLVVSLQRYRQKDVYH